MNFDEMSEEACRDYLAERAGWDEVDHGWMNSDELVNDHPIQATLDEAAKLPEGWFLSGPAIYVDNIKQEIHATAWNGINADCCSRGIASTRGENAELLARFRLRCRVESLTVRAEIN